MEHLALQGEHQPLEAPLQGAIGAADAHLDNSALHHEQGAPRGRIGLGEYPTVDIAIGHQTATQESGAAGEAVCWGVNQARLEDAFQLRLVVQIEPLDAGENRRRLWWALSVMSLGGIGIRSARIRRWLGRQRTFRKRAGCEAW
jgi:hypothetical protein